MHHRTGERVGSSCRELARGSSGTTRWSSAPLPIPRRKKSTSLTHSHASTKKSRRRANECSVRTSEYKKKILSDIGSIRCDLLAPRATRYMEGKPFARCNRLHLYPSSPYQASIWSTRAQQHARRAADAKKKLVYPALSYIHLPSLYSSQSLLARTPLVTFCPSPGHHRPSQLRRERGGGSEGKLIPACYLLLQATTYTRGKCTAAYGG